MRIKIELINSTKTDLLSEIKKECESEKITHEEAIDGLVFFRRNDLENGDGYSYNEFVNDIEFISECYCKGNASIESMEHNIAMLAIAYTTRKM